MKGYGILNKLIRAIKNPQKIISLIKSPRKAYYRLQDHKRDSIWEYHYNKGTVKLPYPPVTFRIEPTNKCNFRCLCCPNGISPLEESGYMEFDFYKHIINQISKITPNAYTRLYLGGEPLMHKKFVEMVDYASKKGLRTTFNTNAALLNEDLSKELIEAGLYRIEISFDDVSPDEYEHVRRNAKYQKTLDNIIVFCNMKKKMNKALPAVVIAGLKFMRDDGKIPSVKPSQSFMDLFSGLGVASIEIVLAHAWAGDFSSNVVYKNSQPERKRAKEFKCYMPWRDLTINYKGQVVACCYDLKYQYVLGDLNEAGIVNIWNNEQYIKFRNLMSVDYQKISLCRSCVFANEEIRYCNLDLLTGKVTAQE